MARPRARAISAQTQLRVGRLVKAHGLKGGLKVELYTDDPDRRFTPQASFALQVPDGSPWHGKRLELAELRWYNGHPVGFFVGVGDRTAAESLVKAILWVDQDPAEQAGDDAWWDHQLIGLDVVRDGESVGVIDRLEHLPAQDLLVVAVGEREVLVPFVRAIVPEVDIARHRVVVSPPQGLFEQDQDGGPEPAGEQGEDQAEDKADDRAEGDEAAQAQMSEAAGGGDGPSSPTDPADPSDTQRDAAAGINGGVPVVAGDPAVGSGSEPPVQGSTAATGVPASQRQADIDADRAAETRAAEAAGIEVRPGEASDPER